jgi:transposase
MRGTPDLQMTMLTMVSPETMVPADHPLRRIRAIVDQILEELDPELSAMYSEIGRPSIPPETLLKSTVLMAMFSIRSERAFCQHLTYNLLFRWFLGMPIDAPTFNPTTFGKNRERLLKAEVAERFLAAVVRQAKLRKYISSDHFSVDGTLLEAWASHKSFRPRDGGRSDPPGPGRNAERDFHGERRTNETHVSTTDPEARMMRKGQGQAAKLSYTGHALVENRSSLIVAVDLTQADGYAERRTALELLRSLPRTKRRRTVAADKAYDTVDFVDGCRELGVTPQYGR